MNIANKLTIFRILLVPLFIIFCLVTSIPYNFLWALIIFIVAALTDVIDGYLARSRNLITDFGKFLDPLADKILVTSSLICFIELGLTPAWMVVVVMSREFLVTSLRLVVASDNGNVIAASNWGKIKTIIQMLAIIIIFTLNSLVQINVISNQSLVIFIGNIFMLVATFVTVISGIDYLWKNRKIVNFNK